MSAMGRPPDGPLVPRGNHLAFRMIRRGTPIGTHTLDFNQVDGGLEVRIGVEAVVKLGPIPLFRYRHTALEVWRANQVMEVRSRTDRNGTELAMQAMRTSAGLTAEGTGTPRYVAPPDALATTYWNRQVLRVPLVGTQDGGLVRPRVTDRGPQMVRTAAGDRLPVECWQLSGDLDLTLYYDAAGQWAGMRFTVADGSEISYERL